MSKPGQPLLKYRVLILILLIGALGILGTRLVNQSHYGSLGTADFIQLINVK